ncbi:MAG: type II secretion system protein GspE, partial [Nitrospinota bacterium]
DAGILREVGIEGIKNPSEMEKFKRGRGCPACYHTGYRGRSGIFEILDINDELRDIINTASDSTTIKAVARKNGMKTLLQDGGLKVMSGVTTPEEVLRIVQS